MWNLAAVDHATTWFCSTFHLSSRIIPKAPCQHANGRDLCTPWIRLHEESHSVPEFGCLTCMPICYSATSKPKSIPVGQSASWEFVPLSFTQDFDLLIQSPCSNLALNNRKLSDFWCITEKNKQSSSIYGLLSGIVQLKWHCFPPFFTEDIREYWQVHQLLTGTELISWYQHLSMKASGAPKSLQRNLKTTIRCLQSVL